MSKQSTKSDIVEHSSRLMILGISGAGRKRSYYTALLEAAKDLLPPDPSLEIVDVSRLPLYNQDLENEMPGPVKELKQKIRGADAILIATPEHNYSITAVLKNAIEWGNRPPGDASWKRQTRRSNQCLDGAARGRESPAPSSIDHDGSKYVPDQ